MFFSINLKNWRTRTCVWQIDGFVVVDFGKRFGKPGDLCCLDISPTSVHALSPTHTASGKQAIRLSSGLENVLECRQLAGGTYFANRGIGVRI